jgi:hypothetical protein
MSENTAGNRTTSRRSDGVLIPVSLMVLTAWAVSNGAEPDDKKAALRKYQAGPLRTAEFRANAKKDSQLDAYTFTEMQYTYEYRYTNTRAGVVVRASRVDVFAVFRPDKSWLRGEVGRRLLDHEQGHFDLLQIHTLRTQAEVDTELRQFVVSAPSKEEGVRKLRARLDKRMSESYAKSATAQEEYDYQTRNGRQADAQSLHRRKQREELERLRKKKPPVAVRD